ncbi:NAD(P)-binding protein [Trichoderma compactum]
MAREKKFTLVTGCGRGGIGEALILEYTRRGIYAIATVLPNENSSYTMTAIDTDVNAVKRMFEVNVFGPMQMVHHFHDMLIQASGTIVNIGSIGGVVPYMYGASYNASKAALHHYSNTLPLQVISGEVGTNILKNDIHRKLPEVSYYSPLAAEFEDHVQRTPKTTSRFEYASNVVSQSLRSSPAAWFWTGSATGIIRLLDMFAWRTIWDFFFYREFNLNKVKEAHLANAKKNT